MVSVRVLAENNAGPAQKIEKFKHWFVRKKICWSLAKVDGLGGKNWPQSLTH